MIRILLCLQSLALLVAAELPTNASVTLPTPSPEEIEKLVCKVASNEIIEKEVTAEVCKVIKDHFATVPDCEAIVTKLWDHEVTARCPKGAQFSVAEASMPEEIEKLLCKVASEENIEKEITSKACSVITKHVPVPDCEAIVTQLWDKAKAMCPKSAQFSAATPTSPTPEEIEKFVCKVASNEIIEKEATAEVCKVIKDHFATVPDCEAIVTQLWDKAKAMCPKSAQFSAATPTTPTPEEIDKFVCKVASNEIIEKEATAEVCKLIKDHFATVPDCEAIVSKLWDNEVTAMCPKGAQSLAAAATPMPEEIEKLLCKVASNEIIEKEVTSKVCSVITKHAPVPDCEGIVTLLWDKAKAMCPKHETAVIV